MIVATAGWPQSPVGPGLGKGGPSSLRRKVWASGVRRAGLGGPGATPQPGSGQPTGQVQGTSTEVVGVFPPNQRGHETFWKALC